MTTECYNVGRENDAKFSQQFSDLVYLRSP